MFAELETDTLQDVIANNTQVVVQYSAGWCGNCRLMKPKFKKFAEEYSHAQFIIIDAEKNPESRKLADVSNLPTFAAFANGKLVNQVQTNRPEVLKEFLDANTTN